MAKRRLISFDWAMKRLLRSKANYKVLEGFLSELLKDDIQIIEVLESESNKESERDKFNRVDLKVQDHQGQILFIEVQYEREQDYLHRILYGTSKIITEHMKESDPYSKVVKVISVHILYFDLGQGEDYIYHGTTHFRGLHRKDELQLSETQRQLFGKDSIARIYPEYYLLKVNRFDDIAHDKLDEWIYFLKNEEIREEFSAKGLKEAKEMLDVLKLSDKERIAYEQYTDDLHYQASMFESSYGVGKLKGIKQGRVEGKEIGRVEERSKMVKQVKKSGMSISEIAALFDVTVEEVGRILNS